MVAARIIGELGLRPRIHSAAALAALGVAPLQVSSGGRHGHKVNFGGNRQLNRAIHIIARRRSGTLPGAGVVEHPAEHQIWVKPGTSGRGTQPVDPAAGSASQLGW